MDEGINLLRVLVEATGLPPEAVERELNNILANRGLTADKITLDQVRELMSAYLQTVLLEAKAEITAS